MNTKGKEMHACTVIRPLRKSSVESQCALFCYDECLWSLRTSKAAGRRDIVEIGADNKSRIVSFNSRIVFFFVLKPAPIFFLPLLSTVLNLSFSSVVLLFLLTVWDGYKKKKKEKRNNN